MANGTYIHIICLGISPDSKCIFSVVGKPCLHKERAEQVVADLNPEINKLNSHYDVEFCLFVKSIPLDCRVKLGPSEAHTAAETIDARRILGELIGGPYTAFGKPQKQLNPNDSEAVPTW